MALQQLPQLLIPAAVVFNGEAQLPDGLPLSLCALGYHKLLLLYLFFQLKTHAQLFEPQEVADDDGEAEEDEQAVIGFASGLFWLAFKTVLIAILSEYVVGTIEVRTIYLLHQSFIPSVLLKKIA